VKLLSEKIVTVQLVQCVLLSWINILSSLILPAHNKNLPIAIYPGMKIGQVSFMQLTKPASVGYGAGIGSKYKGQRGPTPSKYYMNFEEDDKK
jgi:hypothetical protein